MLAAMADGPTDSSPEVVLRYQRLPPPSPLELPRGPLPDGPPALAVRLVLGLRRAMQRAIDALTPAELVLVEQTFGLARTAMLGAVCRFGVPDVLGDRAMTAEEIASARGLDADLVHRTLRALAAGGVFAMDGEGRFRNNRLSRQLAGGGLARLRELSVYFASHSNAAAWVDFARTLETGRPAFRRVHGTSVWDWFERHDDEREIFAHAMMGITVRDAPVVAKLAPLGGVKVLCDVGGGRGTLLSEILLRHPGLRGVLVDSPGVLASARRLLEARGVGERVELVAGSFFDEVPPGADAYLMKNILHDWDDATSARILSVVARAAAPGARLLLCESIVSRTSRDRLATWADLQMIVACEGRERSAPELRRLGEDAGFAFVAEHAHPAISVLELVRR
jgi:hypothetical protein